MQNQLNVMLFQQIPFLLNAIQLLLEVFHCSNSHSSTNTKLYEDAKKGKPYDHVFYTNSSEDEIIKESYKVVDLMKEVRTLYMGESFPYAPYEHNLFRTKFSDHVPIAFKYIRKGEGLIIYLIILVNQLVIPIYLNSSSICYLRKTDLFRKYC